VSRQPHCAPVFDRRVSDAREERSVMAGYSGAV
jgi:hypothetical protein